MKNVIFFATFLFITITSFAQNKTFDENITQLMYAKNGMNGVEKITDQLAQNISDDKKVAFKTVLNKIKNDFIVDTKEEFKKMYTNSQIEAIYSEFHSTKINYSEQTNGFFHKFRSLKGQFFKKAKQLYLENKN